MSYTNCILIPTPTSLSILSLFYPLLPTAGARGLRRGLGLGRAGSGEDSASARGLWHGIGERAGSSAALAVARRAPGERGLRHGPGSGSAESPSLDLVIIDTKLLMPCVKCF
jgi:hypothetical protein